MAKINPSFLHIFPFSERPGTPAVTMPNKVQSSVSTQRVERLEELSNRQHRAFAERYIGTERSVLFESTDHDGMMYGYTDNYLRVVAPYDSRYINTICTVSLDGFDEDGNIRSKIVG